MNSKTHASAPARNHYVDSREVRVPASHAACFAPIRRIGGESGWFSTPLLWRLRAALDRLIGGSGRWRGRRHPDELRVGDTVGLWRVVAMEPDRRLRLGAEMKLPGRAWLEFEVEPLESGSLIRQTATFDPAGVWGRLYWFGLYPVHQVVFSRMLRGIAAAVQRDVSGISSQ